MSDAEDWRTDWPKDGDCLFIESVPASDASVIKEPSERFYRLPMGYKRAGDLLIEQADISLSDRANIIYPALFCYRQAIELYLKRLIGEFGNEDMYSHDLNELWERFMRIYKERTSNESVGLSAMKALVAEMHSVDQKSDGFRFPTARNGNPFSAININLTNVRRAMSGIQNFFDCVYMEFSCQDEILPAP